MSEKTIHISRFIDRYRDRLPWLPKRFPTTSPVTSKSSRTRKAPSVAFADSGPTVENLNSHCCGMIGSWGMAAENYDLSRRIGSDLIEKIEASKAGTSAVTDCPTCRMQMEAFGGKPVMHPVEVLAAERLLP